MRIIREMLPSVPLLAKVCVIGRPVSSGECPDWVNISALDHYQVSGYGAWYRHIPLSMVAAAFLVITRDAAKKGAPAARPA